MRKLLVLNLLLLLVMPLAKAQKRKQETVEGAASFYSDKLHGRRTSNGEVYDKTALTAAHRTLPFGSLVKVTNLRNGREVIVRINDRGPHRLNRMIDLSRAAAEGLGVAPLGCPHVCLELLTDSAATDSSSRYTASVKTLSPEGKAARPKGFGLQVSSFSNWENALCQVEIIRKAGFREVFLQVSQRAGQSLYRVMVGQFPTRSRAVTYKGRLVKAGFASIPVPHLH